MTVQEIISVIPTLSFDERLILLEAVSQSLREPARPRKYNGVSASELRGVLKTEAPSPTDEEIKDDYTDYLMEKYS